MKIIKHAIVALSFFTLPHFVYAQGSGNDFLDTRSVDRAQRWVVSPGTRVVAGDPYQDEFYIVGGSIPIAATEAPPSEPRIQMTARKVNTNKAKIAAKKADVRKIKLALNKAMHAKTSQKSARHQSVASKKSRQKTAKAKQTPHSKVKVAMNHPHHASHTRVDG
jgi:hypothetical protein